MSDLVAASTNSKSWSEREMALIEIHNIVENENSKIRASMWTSIVEATCECLDDGHYRVVHAALDLIRLATTSYDKFDTCLDWILCVVFRLTASKRETKERAVSTLQSIEKACDASTMLSALIVSISSRKANECLESLRFMNRAYTAKDCEMRQHLKRLGVTAMKQLTVRLVTCMKHRSGQIQRAATKLVLFLRNLVGRGEVAYLCTHVISINSKSPCERSSDETSSTWKSDRSACKKLLWTSCCGKREKERNETARDECCQETVITSRKEKEETEENTLSSIITKLKSDESIQDEDVLSCFQDILHFMRTGDKVEWSRCFRDVLDILIKSLSESTKVCERALF